ncbi:MAG: hypothetical protein GY716_16110 [bacterium]|nr:hypothetical protein [bacterium]
MSTIAEAMAWGFGTMVGAGIAALAFFGPFALIGFLCLRSAVQQGASAAADSLKEKFQ